MQSFIYDGEPIEDIKAWAAARGERMVTFRERRWVSCFNGPGYWTKWEHGEMPESFFNTRRISGKVQIEEVQ